MKTDNNIQKSNQEAFKTKMKTIFYNMDIKNNICPDCGKKKSMDFASINNGIIICADCAKEHEKLGYNISFLRSLGDKWDDYLFNYIKAGGNSRFIQFCKDYKVDKENNNIIQKYKSKGLTYYRDIIRSEVLGYDPPDNINVNKAFEEDPDIPDNYPEFKKYSFVKHVDMNYLEKNFYTKKEEKKEDEGIFGMIGGFWGNVKKKIGDEAGDLMKKVSEKVSEIDYTGVKEKGSSMLEYFDYNAAKEKGASMLGYFFGNDDKDKDKNKNKDNKNNTTGTKPNNDDSDSKINTNINEDKIINNEEKKEDSNIFTHIFGVGFKNIIKNDKNENQKVEKVQDNNKILENENEENNKKEENDIENKLEINLNLNKEEIEENKINEKEEKIKENKLIINEKEDENNKNDNQQNNLDKIINNNNGNNNDNKNEIKEQNEEKEEQKKINSENNNKDLELIKNKGDNSNKNIENENNKVTHETIEK